MPTLNRSSMVLWLFAAVCVALLSVSARAQTVQPTYIRPSKGATITIASNVALAAGTSVVSPVFDWSAFSGVQVFVTTTLNQCSYYPAVTVFGAGSAAATTFSAINERNSLNVLNAGTVSDFTYIVKVPAPFVKLTVTSVPAPTGAKACSTTVQITPVPVTDEAESVAQSSSLLQANFALRWWVRQIAATPTNVGPVRIFGNKAILVQNQTTVPVFCAPTYEAAGNMLSTTNYAFILPAATAAANGTSAPLKIEVNGPIYCIVDAAAACLPNSCNVSYIAY